MSSAYTYPEPRRIPDSIDKYVLRLMKDIRSVVNNSKYFLNGVSLVSYSKNLAAPLWKYNRKTPLIIDELPLDSVNIRLEAGVDRVSGTVRKTKDVTVPFSLFSNKNFEKMLRDENFTLSVAEITIDISKVGRNRLDNFFRDSVSDKFKRHASYIKDKEVVTSRSIPSRQAHVIKDRQSIQLLRLIYIMSVRMWYNERVGRVIEAILANQLPDIMLLPDSERLTIRWVIDYLGNKENWDEEWRSFIDISEGLPSSIVNNINGDKLPPIYLRNHEKFFCKFLREKMPCFDRPFLDKILPALFDEGSTG